MGMWGPIPFDKIPRELKHTARNIPPDKLFKLLTVSDDLIRDIFHAKDEGEAMTAVCRRIHQLMNVECCGIFLAPEGKSDRISLVAYKVDRNHEPPSREEIQLVSLPGSGLTGHIAKQGKLVRLSGAQISSSQFHSGASPTFLPSGECHSLLAAPMYDRKGRTLGLLKFENRKGTDGVPRAQNQFDEVDEAIASVMAHRVVLLVQNLRDFWLFREFMEQMLSADTLSGITDTVLRKSKALLFADRVDLALWSKARGKLIVAGYEGDPEPENRLEKWAELPDPSVMRSVWNDGDAQGRLIRNVLADSSYHMAHSKTRSQLTICLKNGDRPLGVLSAESFNKDEFDQKDIDTLRMLAWNASIAIQAVGDRFHIQGILLPDSQGFDPSEEVLERILQAALDQHKLEAGLIYISDNQAKLLRCLAFVDRVRKIQLDHRSFCFRFTDQSAATWVHKNREPLFSNEPYNDSRFDKRGLDHFGITGLVVLVPLIYGETVVGVLVVWSGCDTPQANELIDQLTPFTHLAAAHIARFTQAGVPGTLRSKSPAGSTILLPQRIEQDDDDYPPGELTEEKNLRLIGIGIEAAGLDRARVFRFDGDQEGFRLVATFGMSGEYESLPLVKSDYTVHAEQTFLSNPGARKYDPTDPTMFGPDNFAGHFDKPDDLPWAAVPLVVGGELYGQIAADNRITGREITPDTLEYLTLTGSLVSREIEKANQKRRQAALSKSEALYHSLIDNLVGASIFRKNAGGKFKFVNDRFCELMETAREDIIGKTDTDFFPPKKVEEYLEGDRRAMLDGDFDAPDEVFVSPKTRRHYELHVKKTPIYDPNGQVIGVQGICWDVTQVRFALRDALVDVQHRLQNNLARISNLLQLKRRGLEEGDGQSALDDCIRTIEVMSLVHNMLHDRGTTLPINASEYFPRLCDYLFDSLLADSPNISKRVEITPMSLSARTTITCGLIVNELVTNATKHAFPHGRSGEICVSLIKDRDREVTLQVRDDGVGFNTDAVDSNSSLGLRLLRSWAENGLENGSLGFSGNGGTTVTIRFSPSNGS